MKTIELSKGFKAVVDDSDFEELSRHRWHVLVAFGCLTNLPTPKSVGFTMPTKLLTVLFLLFLALGCAPVSSSLDAGAPEPKYVCRSAFGTKLVILPGTSPSLGDCYRFGNQEHVSLTAILKVLGPGAHRRVLHALPDTTVEVHPIGTIHIVDGVRAIGWTNCNGTVVLTEQEPAGSWSNSILPHEYTHLAQGCIPPKHEDWKLLGADTIETSVNTTNPEE